MRPKSTLETLNVPLIFVALVGCADFLAATDMPLG